MFCVCLLFARCGFCFILCGRNLRNMVNIKCILIRLVSFLNSFMLENIIETNKVKKNTI